MRVLLTISTCPYLIPRNRARSLSTAMEVSVARDTPKKTVVTIYAEFLALRQRVQFSVIRDKNIVIANGCEMRPAQRSVIVKLRSKIFDVGRRDASFLKCDQNHKVFHFKLRGSSLHMFSHQRGTTTKI